MEHTKVNSFYSFHSETFCLFICRNSDNQDNLEKPNNKDECSDKVESINSEIKNKETSLKWDQEKLKNLSRKFNIDLVPKVLTVLQIMFN